MKITTFKNDSIAAKAKDLATSLAALPPASTSRWVASRKAAVVAAVQAGLLTVMEACRRYGLSHEEFAEWERRYESEGLKGLRARSRPRPPDYPMN
jgi:hypothetical protein